MVGRVMGILWILFCTASVAAAAPAAGAGPAVRDITGTVRHPLDPEQKLASVLIFYLQDCPICNSYAPEINRLAGTLTNFAFYIVQVDSGLTPEAAKDHTRQYSLRPPVLLDSNHELVKRTGATVTPQAIVIGKDGRILYRGRIDNLYIEPGKRRSLATVHDLRDVLQSIQAGRPVDPAETKAVGCVI